MSLAVEGSGRRGHSRSRSRDRRQDEEPAYDVRESTREPSYVYPEDDLDDRYKSSRRRESAKDRGGLPYPAKGDLDDMLPGNQSLYSYDDPRPSYRAPSPSIESPYRTSREKVQAQSQLPGSFPEDKPSKRDDGDSRRVRYAEPRDSYGGRHNRPDDVTEMPLVRYAEPSKDKYGRSDDDDEKLKYLPQKYSRRYNDDDDDDKYSSRAEDKKSASGYRAHDDDKYASRDKDKRKDGWYNDDEDDKYASRDNHHRKDSRYDDEDDKYAREKDRKKDSRYDDEDDKYAPREKDKKKDRRGKKEREEEDLAYGRPPGPPRSPRADLPPTYGSYIPGSQGGDKHSSKYGDRDDDGDRRRPESSSAYDPYAPGGRSGDKTSSKYADRDDRDDRNDRRRPASPPADDYDSRKSQRSSHRDDPRSSGTNILTVDPSSRDRRRDKSPGPSALAVDSKDRRRDKSPGPSVLTVDSSRRDRASSRDRRGERDRSPQPPTARMSSLSVGGDSRPSNMSLALAPGSPLLESYHGTYQDCSPMPSPLLLASKSPMEDPRMIEPLSPSSDMESGKISRRARFHDPEDIATSLARALKGDRPPDTEPLVAILPSLTHEQVIELRAEYKRLVKTGSDRKGVNIAKHIRARLKDEDPNLMKACYAVALGMWESEAYWANFWYQGDKTRRELLIESLMGRTNAEVRLIKDAFTDKKYDNSLAKCMKTELKEDKFKKAVLMVLEERRMEDVDHYGRRVPVDFELVEADVGDLHKGVRSDKGGESLMISIVVQRNDEHLRAVLKEYEQKYRVNFAREALKKSTNLVGELLAHILNGVINRPVRDALLLHHAVTGSRKDSLRRELLISRLVRFHWDAAHMQAVKRAYRERYGRDLQEAVREATNGQWGLFCSELCIARMPNDVRRV